jgi:hypothetical protein
MKKIYVTTGFLTTFLLASLTGLAQTQSRPEIQKQIEARRAELVELEKMYLEPSAEDRKRYAEFLRQPNTGLIRLLPRETFHFGEYYSFSAQTHEYVSGTDLGLELGQFRSGFAGANYGFMTNLGDVPIEEVGATTPGVTFFAAYKAPKEEQLARKEYYRLARGAEIDKLPVARSVPVQKDTTYLLRSINYGYSDVLVAFRVVRIDSDGSAIIVWKLLVKYETPKLNPAEPPTVG